MKLTSGCILASSAIRRCFVDTSVDSNASSVCPPNGSMTRRPPSLHRVPLGQVPPLQRYYEDATTSRCPFRLASFPSLSDTFSPSLLLCRACITFRGYRTVVRGPGVTSRFPHPGSQNRRQRDLPSSWVTLSYICRALGPRRNFDARLLQRLGAAPAFRTTKAPA